MWDQIPLHRCEVARDLRRGIENLGILHVSDKNGEQAEDYKKDQFFLRTNANHRRNYGCHAFPPSGSRRGILLVSLNPELRTVEAQISAFYPDSIDACLGFFTVNQKIGGQDATSQKSDYPNCRDILQSSDAGS